MLCEAGQRLKEADERATRDFGLFLELLRNSPKGLEELRKNERVKKEMEAARAAYEKHPRN
jgi:hypothetical protein